MPNSVYLSFGSNIGNRTKRIINSILLLKKHKIFLKNISSFYLSEPYGYIEQSYFLNAVGLFECKYLPIELLMILKKVETLSHREKTFRWGPRTLDIDILLYNQETINEENLKIPHYDMNNRSFVLIPLLEISPEIYDPISGKKYKCFFEKMEKTDIKRVILNERIIDYLGEII